MSQLITIKPFKCKMASFHSFVGRVLPTEGSEEVDQLVCCSFNSLSI